MISVSYSTAFTVTVCILVASVAGLAGVFFAISFSLTSSGSICEADFVIAYVFS